MTDGAGGPAAAVHTVLVVAKSHLDVGFTDLAAAVRERWLRELLPRAVHTAAALRDRGAGPRLCWTTPSWILHEALEDGDQGLRAMVDAAVGAGDLAWHAAPFTTHTELVDRSLFAHGLSISARLDQRFGRRTRAAKLTDVPGHTRAVVSLLAEAGVDLLHVGVNPAAASPDVPELFRWRDDAAASVAHPSEPFDATGRPDPPAINVLYRSGGYGALQVLGDSGVAVDLWVNGDNDGPPDVDDVVARWDRLRLAHPAAEIRAATLDDVADVVRSVAADLPVLNAEIGDTWIHGIASDPSKTAAFRETCRRRRSWIDSGAVAADDPALWSASTELLLVAEHTWGLDQKTHWPDTDHWSESALASVRPRPATRRFEWSWSEQRSYLDRFLQRLEAAGRSDLAADARAGMLLTGAAPVSVDGLVALSRPDDGGPIRARLGPLEVAVDPHDGALVELVVDAEGGGRRDLVGGGRALGRVGHRTYDAADYERWFSTYNAGTRPEDRDWARWDNTKPGLDRSGARSAWYAPDLVGAWTGRRDADGGGPGAEVLVLELSFSDETRSLSAAPPWVLVGYELVDGRPDELSVWVQWVGKAAARWPESTWCSFVPTVADDDAWTMSKMGEDVSPLDVVSRGARTLHAADVVRHRDGIRLELIDAPLVAPGSPSLLRFEDRLPDLAGGWHVCLYANVWGTNFPMWCPGDARFRLTLGW